MGANPSSISPAPSEGASEATKVERALVPGDEVERIFDSLKREYTAQIAELSEKYGPVKEGTLRRDMLKLYLEQERKINAGDESVEQGGDTDNASQKADGGSERGEEVKLEETSQVSNECADGNKDGNNLDNTSAIEKAHKEAYSNKKVLDKLGDISIAPEKAQKRRGSDMTAEQRKAQIEAERLEEEEKKKTAQAMRNKIIKERNDSIEDTVTKQVEPKALELLADSKLEKMSQEIIPEGSKVNSKAIHMMGDIKVIPSKAAKRRGSDMHHDQRMAMMRAEEKERRDTNRAKGKKKHNFLGGII